MVVLKTGALIYLYLLWVSELKYVKIAHIFKALKKSSLHNLNLIYCFYKYIFSYHITDKKNSSTVMVIVSHRGSGSGFSFPRADPPEIFLTDHKEYLDMTLIVHFQPKIILYYFCCQHNIVQNY